jgi:hypothetical protein
MDQNRRICDQFCSMCLRYFDVDIELGTENLETSAHFYRHLQVTCALHSLLNRVFMHSSVMLSRLSASSARLGGSSSPSSFCFFAFCCLPLSDRAFSLASSAAQVRWRFSRASCQILMFLQASLSIQTLMTLRMPSFYCSKLQRERGDLFANLFVSVSLSRSWQLIQKDCSIQPPFCTQRGNDNDDCGVQVAWLYVCYHCLFVHTWLIFVRYFDVFFLFTRCVFLNLFTVRQERGQSLSEFTEWPTLILL